jgi:SAM-dependent methyltransferase
MPEDYIKRFTGRAEVYSKYRPNYPREILGILGSEIGFDVSWVVADVGSGTGLLSRLFLEYGNRVFGVEPNDEMKNFAEQNLSEFPNFVSIKGTAEDTTMETGSVHLVCVGQAIHWFDQTRARREFARIAKQEGHLCVVNNDRDKTDPVMQAYEAVIVKHEGDRASVPEIDDAYLAGFFTKGVYRKFVVPNAQNLDLEGLLGRITSASYMPSVREKVRYQRMKEDVSKLFDSFAKNGRVKLLYNTTFFLGKIRD